MGRGKLEIKKIDDKSKRQVTFSKRRNGIMKKAHELTVLCDAKVSLLIISSTNKLHHFLSPGLSLKKMFDEYQKIEGVDLWLKHSERMEEEQRKLLELNNMLRTEISRRMGGDLEGLTLLELSSLQQEMEEAIAKIRNQQSSEAVIPAESPQHEKETSNQTGMWQQSSFVHAQKSVIPDPEGFDKIHSSRQLDLPVESLNHNLPAASSPTTSISATAGSGGTKDADDTTSRGGTDLASENLNSVHGDISGNCVLGSGLQGSDSFNLTEIAGNMCKGLDEVNSFRSEATLVSVRGYKVKPKYESLLGYILSKYGDIGANCSLGTVKFRSLYMDAICEIIHKLKDTNIVAITEDDLQEMMGCVVDVEKANIDIGWLKERLNEIREAKQAVQFLGSSSIDKNRHAELKAQVKKRNQQLEEYKRELADKEVVLRDLEKEIFDTEREIVAMEDGVAEVEKVILEKQAKVRHFVEVGALGHGLI